MKPALAVKQTVGNQRVQVRMKIEIFAEGVDRHDDGWNAIVRRVANAACIAERIPQKVTHALMRDAAELLQSASRQTARVGSVWGGAPLWISHAVTRRFMGVSARWKWPA